MVVVGHISICIFGEKEFQLSFGVYVFAVSHSIEIHVNEWFYYQELLLLDIYCIELVSKHVGFLQLKLWHFF